MIGREAIESVELGGYVSRRGPRCSCPNGSFIAIARWFDDPEAFHPERWADGLMQRIHRYAYFPFGGGPRICIGNNFALMEATLILATIARQYRLKLARDASIVPLPTITLRPAHGVKVVLGKRLESSLNGQWTVTWHMEIPFSEIYSTNSGPRILPTTEFP